MIPSFYGENYDVHWRGVSFLGKKILDVGADIGSTASYFLCKGASLVYAVEGNRLFYEELERNSNHELNIVPIFLWVDSQEKWMELIISTRPDLVKVDCEGCERHLLDLPNEIFGSIPEYIIEAHRRDLFDALLSKLQENYYQIFHYEYINDLNIIIGRHLSKYRLTNYG